MTKPTLEGLERRIGMDIAGLELDMAIESGTGSRLRAGVKKLCIRSDFDGKYDVEIWRKKGGAEIKWHAHVEVDHPTRFERREGTHWVWGYSNLSARDMIEMGEWLIRKAGK